MTTKIKMIKLVLFLFILKHLSLANAATDDDFKQQQQKQTNEELGIIHLAVVSCGDRVPETLTLLKSALLFTNSKLKFYIVTESNLKDLFVQQFKKWPNFIQSRFEYEIMEPQFPRENELEWRNLFRLCASQRIFLPEILTHVDSLLYTDTDVLFLTDLDSIWSHFNKFNRTQLAALTPEHEEANMGWYNRFARHPYYGRLGLNSGVMLMNLTRMREFDFVNRILPIYKEYKYNITWGDQCLLNILFHFHPDKVYDYDCSWNFRPDHCMYGLNCRAADLVGAKILHGCRRVFHNEKEPAFRHVYAAFNDYEFDETENVYLRIKNAFEMDEVARTYCGKAKEVFLRTLKKSLKAHKSLMKNWRNNFNNNSDSVQNQNQIEKEKEKNHKDEF